jgi:hypothetical protein
MEWPLRKVVIRDVVIAAMYEHTPLDYYSYGEYPRFQRPVRPPDLKTEWVYAPADKETT